VNFIHLKIIIKPMHTKPILTICLLLFGSLAFGQNTSNHGKKFEQLGTLLPTPNAYRAPDGQPGPKYWQQRADYAINCTLDVDKQWLQGEEVITYHNQSPMPLRYLWFQLDENEHDHNGDNQRFDPSAISPAMDQESLQALERWRLLEKYGHNIESVRDIADQELHYVINQTMMRVDLPQPLPPGESVVIKIDWNYYLIDRVDGPTWGRGGYEYFPDNDNYLFTITQWYPRLCVYSDFEGWQNKQFTGRGEFALTFGDFVVNMTVPDDYVVGSTGECLNYRSTLTDTQWERWQQAQNAQEPVEIVTLQEAKKWEKRKKSQDLQTWIYKADNVRDFAWTASRKFIWDAMPHFTETGQRVMCMSYYPKESYPIYRRYSTKTVAHTLKTYSKFSIPYPYPVAISVEAQNGMEYPMICFNPGRAEEDGTYTEQAKKSAITVIIHEVGHNYYPMIINSDERQWSWFDEGLNTFMQFIAEQEFDNNYSSDEGPPHLAVPYMSSPRDQLEPIMTNSENIVQFFPNAYLKPATALTVLRETVMGRELFDHAFKEYGRRWAFKHPTPADFFRTMEDASGVDLDWFWRGWFYSIDPVDIALDSVIWYQVDMENDPSEEEISYSYPKTKAHDHLTRKRNREEGMAFAVDQDTSLRDFYTDYAWWETEDSMMSFKFKRVPYRQAEKQELYGDKHFYELHFSNVGGLVMPVILQWTFQDGSTEVERIPVEIWRRDEEKFKKVFVKDKVVTQIQVDPFLQTADIDTDNNSWPKTEPKPTRFQVFKEQQAIEQANPMQKAKAGKGKTK
jgi:hypothetical protein